MYKITYSPDAESDLAKLVYRIFDTEILVEILTAYGHYNDK